MRPDASHDDVLGQLSGELMRAHANKPTKARSHKKSIDEMAPNESKKSPAMTVYYCSRPLKDAPILAKLDRRMRHAAFIIDDPRHGLMLFEFNSHGVHYRPISEYDSSYEHGVDKDKWAFEIGKTNLALADIIILAHQWKKDHPYTVFSDNCRAFVDHSLRKIVGEHGSLYDDGQTRVNAQRFQQSPCEEGEHRIRRKEMNTPQRIVRMTSASAAHDLPEFNPAHLTQLQKANWHSGTYGARIQSVDDQSDVTPHQIHPHGFTARRSDKHLPLPVLQNDAPDFFSADHPLPLHLEYQYSPGSWVETKAKSAALFYDERDLAAELKLLEDGLNDFGNKLRLQYVNSFRDEKVRPPHGGMFTGDGIQQNSSLLQFTNKLPPSVDEDGNLIPNYYLYVITNTGELRLCVRRPGFNLENYHSYLAGNVPIIAGGEFRYNPSKDGKSTMATFDFGTGHYRVAESSALIGYVQEKFAACLPTDTEIIFQHHESFKNVNDLYGKNFQEFASHLDSSMRDQVSSELRPLIGSESKSWIENFFHRFIFGSKIDDRNVIAPWLMEKPNKPAVFPFLEAIKRSVAPKIPTTSQPVSLRHNLPAVQQDLPEFNPAHLTQLQKANWQSSTHSARMQSADDQLDKSSLRLCVFFGNGSEIRFKPWYRGDTRAPHEIHSHGFIAYAPNDNLASFLFPGKNFVSTTTSKDIAIKFCTNWRLRTELVAKEGLLLIQEGFVYEINPQKNARYIPKALRKAIKEGRFKLDWTQERLADVYAEKEMSILWEIKAPAIKGAHRIKKTTLINKEGALHDLPTETTFIPNPHYAPPFARTTKVLRIGGRVLTVVAVAVDGANLYFAYNRSQSAGNYEPLLDESARIAGGWAGAYAGGVAGAHAGAVAGGAIGTLFGGAGAVPGAFIGGVVLGVSGSVAGYRAGGSVAKKARSPEFHDAANRAYTDIVLFENEKAAQLASIGVDYYETDPICPMGTFELAKSMLRIFGAPKIPTRSQPVSLQSDLSAAQTSMSTSQSEVVGEAAWLTVTSSLCEKIEEINVTPSATQTNTSSEASPQFNPYYYHQPAEKKPIDYGTFKTTAEYMGNGVFVGVGWTPPQTHFEFKMGAYFDLNDSAAFIEKILNLAVSEEGFVNVTRIAGDDYFYTITPGNFTVEIVILEKKPNAKPKLNKWVTASEERKDYKKLKELKCDIPFWNNLWKSTFKSKFNAVKKNEKLVNKTLMEGLIPYINKNFNQRVSEFSTQLHTALKTDNNTAHANEITEFFLERCHDHPDAQSIYQWAKKEIHSHIVTEFVILVEQVYAADSVEKKEARIKEFENNHRGNAVLSDDLVRLRMQIAADEDCVRQRAEYEKIQSQALEAHQKLVKERDQKIQAGEFVQQFHSAVVDLINVYASDSEKRLEALNSAVRIYSGDAETKLTDEINRYQHCEEKLAEQSIDITEKIELLQALIATEHSQKEGIENDIEELEKLKALADQQRQAIKSNRESTENRLALYDPQKKHFYIQTSIIISDLSFLILKDGLKLDYSRGEQVISNALQVASYWLEDKMALLDAANHKEISSVAYYSLMLKIVNGVFYQEALEQYVLAPLQFLLAPESPEVLLKIPQIRAWLSLPQSENYADRMRFFAGLCLHHLAHSKQNPVLMMRLIGFLRYAKNCAGAVSVWAEKASGVNLSKSVPLLNKINIPSSYIAFTIAAASVINSCYFEQRRLAGDAPVTFIPIMAEELCRHASNPVVVAPVFLYAANATVINAAVQNITPDIITAIASMLGVQVIVAAALVVAVVKYANHCAIENHLHNIETKLKNGGQQNILDAENEIAEVLKQDPENKKALEFRDKIDAQRREEANKLVVRAALFEVTATGVQLFAQAAADHFRIARSKANAPLPNWSFDTVLPEEAGSRALKKPPVVSSLLFQPVQKNSLSTLRGIRHASIL